jgi:hypothetical protein
MADDGTTPAPADEFSLRPPEGPGREAIERFLDPPQFPADEPVAAQGKDYQFRLTDMLVVTAGIALGLAGGSWMPRDIFAAVLGLVTLGALMLIHFYPPETRQAKLLWGTLVLAYLISVAAAVCFPVMREALP